MNQQSSPSVDQLIVGYSQRVGCGFSASGSVTLIRAQDTNILVDCGDPWNGQEILDKLQFFGIQNEDISTVIVTHGHIDHCGNLSLFQGAKVYMDSDVAYRGKYSTTTQGESVELLPNVQLNRYPGHTDHDLVVTVSGTDRGCIVIAGDIFECADDVQWRELSRYPELQEESRSKILHIADWIIPGHGPMFRNDRRFACL